ncbi:MAG: serine/threonine-protein phosphatase [Hellea sp.]|nr:serine/threonine-protein phosphatase [Hellea sp.]
MIKYNLESSGMTDVGLKREVNEDAIFVDDALGLWVVADGMGGHENGAFASKTAVDGFRNWQLPQSFDEAVEAVAQRIHEINTRLVRISKENDVGQMGTTIVALLIRNERFAIIWVGDSRAYIFRRGGLFQLSVDHTHVQDLVDNGLLSLSEAEHHPMGHVLTRALGVQDDVQVDVVQDLVETGDRFLLCSDGLTGPVNNEHIRELVSQGAGSIVTKSLINAAYAGGAPDNVSVILVMAERAY